MSKKIITLIVILSQFFGHMIVLAETYYVATDGSNRNTGTVSEPWKTIQYAANQVEPGDVVSVRGGIYRETIDFKRGGTEDAWITFQAFEEEDVEIRWSKEMSDSSDWVHFGGNIWHSTGSKWKHDVYNHDVSTIWHDNQSHHSYKKYKAGEQKKQWDFYHNEAAGRIEVWSEGNPAGHAEHIEIPMSPPSRHYQFVTLIQADYLIIDGFHYKYTNVHAIQVQGRHHIIFRNGSGLYGGGGNIHHWYDPPVRWGEVLDIVGDSHHIYFENSVFGEYPDGLLTFQGNGHMHHIYFRNNHLFNATNAFHSFLGEVNQANTNSSVYHIYWEGNTFENIAQGWFEDQGVMTGGMQFIPRENVENGDFYIRNNTFVDCGATRRDGSNWTGVNAPINIAGGDVTIAGNVIVGSVAEGIHIRKVHQKFCGDILNNLIVNSGWSGIFLHKDGYTNDVAIYNNTIVNNGALQRPNVDIQEGAELTVVNNIFFSDRSLELSSAGGHFDYNLFGTMTALGSHSILGDPRFINTAASDFHLSEASPCIDAGTDVPAADVDLDSLPRPFGRGIDIGAYEFSDTSKAIHSVSAKGPLALRTYPNPAIAGSPIQLLIHGYEDGQIPILKIVNVQGRLIRRMHIVTAEGGVNIWDGTDAYGRLVASGQYLLIVKCGEAVSTESVILLNP